MLLTIPHKNRSESFVDFVNLFDHTILGSTATKQTVTVNVDPVYDEVTEQDIEMKENSAYGTVLAAVSTQLGEHQGEETT